MKVLHVTPSFHPAYYYGGPTYSTYGLCNSIAAAGCDVRVLTTNANGPSTLDVETSRDLMLAPQLHVRYCRRVAPESVSAELLRCLPSYVAWADVVHLTAVYNFTTFPVLVAARFARKPLVWSLRGALLRWTHSRRRGLKRLWELASRALAPSATVMHTTSREEALGSSQRFPHARIVVIPNGIEVPPHVAQTQSPELRILYLGRLDPIKAIDNLIEACHQLKRDAPALVWSLTIAGGGTADYEEWLKGLVRDRDIAARTRFVGHVTAEHKSELFAHSDVTVVASHSENFGMVVAESLAHAVPVVASKATPWQELELRGCGLWVENDPESLSAALKRIESMDRKAMGVAGRAWMQQSYEWSKVASDTIELYKETLRSQGSST